MSNISRFNYAIERIKTDELSGSVTLLNNYITAVNQLLSSHKPDVKKFVSALKISFTMLEEHTQTFPVLGHFLSFLKTAANEVADRDKLSTEVHNYQQEWSDVNEKIASKAAQVIDWKDKTIMVHSNSSTVVEFFKSTVEHQQLPCIIQTESRPNYEGRVQAEALAALGLSVTIIIDAAMAMYADKTDLAIVGADAISEQYFVNKTGTRLLAQACSSRKIPFYVLSDSRKTIKEENLPGELMQSPNEVWADPVPGVTPENYYFELTPVSLVTKIISEKN